MIAIDPHRMTNQDLDVCVYSYSLIQIIKYNLSYQKMKGNDTLAKIYLLKFFFDGLFFLKN